MNTTKRTAIATFLSLLMLLIALPGLAQRVSPIRRAEPTPTADVIVGEFEIEFLGYVYNVPDDQSTWSYKITWNGEGGALSHWTLGLCTDITNSHLVSWTPPGPVSIGTDNPTGLWGIKFDMGQTVMTQVYTFTLRGLWELDENAFVATKAGTVVERGVIPGPGCITCKPPAYTLSPVRFCAGSSLTATFTATPVAPPAHPGTGPFTYTWTFDNQPLTDADNSIEIDTSAMAAGIYPVSVTVTGACATVSKSTTLTIDPVPTVGAGEDTELTCTDMTATLSGTSSLADVTWKWTGPDGFTSTLQNPTVDKPGTYVLTVTTSAGCTATDQVVVIENKKPPLITATGGHLDCNIKEVTLTAGGGVSYAWTGPDGFVSALQSPKVSTPGTYEVTVTGANGCKADAKAVVTQDIVKPEVTATGGELTCEIKVIEICAKGGVEYSWIGPGIVGPTDVACISVDKPGDYTVTVTGENGCTATYTVKVTQNIETPDVAAKGGTLTCAVTELTLEATSVTDGVTYSWTGPGIVSGGDTVSPLIDKPGDYIVTVKGPNGCTNTAKAVVGEDLTKPTVTLGAPAVMCAGKQGMVTVSSSLTDATFEWTITNGWFDAEHPITTISGTATSRAFYAGTDLTQAVEITVSTKSENGCVGTDVARIQPVPCEEFHTVTQGYYGNPGGMYFGMTTEQILGILLAPLVEEGPGPLTVGLAGRSATFSSAGCILERLPGGGTSAVLPAGEAGGCPGVYKARSTRNGSAGGNGLLLDKDGTFTNTLLAQTITLALNLRLDEYITHKNLDMWELCPTVTTKETVMGPDGFLIPNPNPGPDGVLYTTDDTKTISIPQSVIDALKSMLGRNPTVADLLDLCNQALGGQPTGVSLADIGVAAEAINRGFDMGRFVVSCNVPVTTLESALRVEPSRTDLVLCEQIEPVTTWTLLGRNDDISDELKAPIPASLLTALNSLGLPNTVGGLAELERMVVEGHHYLAGAEPADVIAVNRRIARLITNSDLVGLCR